MSHRSLGPWCLVLALALPACASSSATLYDFDGDGSLDENDCDTVDPSIYPLAADPYGDDIDQDCDGYDGIDRDGDGYPANLQPADPLLDCNDGESAIHPQAEDQLGDGIDSNCDDHDGVDLDGDGYASIASLGTDCDDDKDNVHPGASDNVGDQLDSNCDGHDGTDNDGDGYASSNSEGSDCDDSQPLAFPGNPEDCDGIDNDCDEAVDNGFDADGDGVTTCGPDGAAGSADDDCNDADAQINPGLAELCDLYDNNCDGQQPADEVDADGDTDPACSDCNDDPANGGDSLSSLDDDGDGYSSCGADGIPDNGDEDCNDDPGADGASSYPGAEDQWGDQIDTNCDGPDGIDLDGDLWAVNAVGPERDCDDTEASSYPGASDPWGDGIDSNCDGPDGEDLDGDGWVGNRPAGDPELDCNDVPTDPFATQFFPGAPDFVLGGEDNNCDGTIGTDADGDLHASIDSGGDDCDDSNANTYPGTPGGDPFGDGVDSNCDGVDGEDNDGDGYAGNVPANDPNYSQLWDCDDVEAQIYPGAPDDWTGGSGGQGGGGVDSNCDGSDGIDADGDGWAVNAGGAAVDCDDTDPLSYPGATDHVSTGVDNNCDGIPGTDSDGDQHASVSSGGDDCDDLDATTYPGAADPPGNGRDEDCDNCGPNSNSNSPLVPGDGIDTDCDGYALNGAGSAQDCDDDNEDIFPGSQAPIWESPGNQTDTNCDGDFSTLVNRANVTFEGISGDDASGTSVEAVGDMDGDGIEDFIIGAPHRSIQEMQDAGAAYLVFGTEAQGLHNNISLMDSRITSLWSTATGTKYVGSSFAVVGDLDGDGLGDLAIGAKDRVYIVGSLQVRSGQHNVDLDSADIILQGQTNEYAGWSLAGGADIDGDGKPDLLVGAPGAPNDFGRVYVVDGQRLGHLHSAGGQVDLEQNSHELTCSTRERCGFSVAFADIDQSDGYADLVIGAPEAAIGGADTGRAYLVRGSDLAGNIPMGQSSALTNVSIGLIGQDAASLAASSVASAGDVDGDGDDDILIGAPKVNDGTQDEIIWAGRTYLLLASTLRGMTNVGGSYSLSNADYRFVGEFAGDKSGSFVAGAGDVDGDGFADMLIGAPENSDNGTFAGKTYLVLGNQLAAHGGATNNGAVFAPNSNEPLSLARAAFSGTTYTRSGSSGSRAGDIDRDGREDLVIGAPDAIVAGQFYAGKTYLLLSEL